MFVLYVAVLLPVAVIEDDDNQVVLVEHTHSAGERMQSNHATTVVKPDLRPAASHLFNLAISTPVALSFLPHSVHCQPLLLFLSPPLSVRTPAWHSITLANHAPRDLENAMSLDIIIIIIIILGFFEFLAFPLRESKTVHS